MVIFHSYVSLPEGRLLVSREAPDGGFFSLRLSPQVPSSRLFAELWFSGFFNAQRLTAEILSDTKSTIFAMKHLCQILPLRWGVSGLKNDMAARPIHHD